ncbi:MAG TPA: hypothetical protein VK081_00125, partial [Planctomycetota bacterium]|nr:hypothetical protein [Planctomycetota bacterium]
NWRLARSIAEEQLSKLQAGANEFKPEPMPVDVEGYPGFRYVVLIGQEAISNAEAEIDNMMADDMTTSDRRMWQRERDDLRMARQKGLSIDDYRRQTLERESDPNAVPSEDDLEEVAVIVYFPNATLDPDDPRREQTFILKAKVSTLAIHGLTPQQADGLAAQKGLTANNPSGGAGAAPGGKSDG